MDARPLKFKMEGGSIIAGILEESFNPLKAAILAITGLHGGGVGKMGRFGGDGAFQGLKLHWGQVLWPSLRIVFLRLVARDLL